MKSKLNRLRTAEADFFNKQLNPLAHPPGIFSLRLFVLMILFLLHQYSSAQPIAYMKDAKVNFGFVKRGEQVICTYTVSNTGNEALLFTEAEISCSCTRVNFSKAPLAPGQSSIIELVFDTKSVYGRQDRIVFMHSNATNSPLKLRYKGVVSGK